MSDGILWADMVKEFGGGFEPLPVDDYDVLVESAEYKVAGTGKDMIKVKFRVQGGPYNNRTVYWNAVFSPRDKEGKVNEGALRAWFGNMSCFGLKTAFFAANPSMEQIAANMVGKKVIVSLGIRVWQDQEQNDVKRVKPPVGGAVEVNAPSVGLFGVATSLSPSDIPPVTAGDDEDDAPF